MKVKFLGTSYGAPSPGRHQQSILAEINEKAYLFDAGAPVLDILVNEGYDLTKIKAIFISHMHGDHINGLFDILNLSAYFNMSFTLYLPEYKNIDFFKSYLEEQCGVKIDPNVKFNIISEGSFFDDGEMRVEAYRTAHTENILSYGFLMSSDDKTVYITGDIHSSMNDLPELLNSRDTDMIITECAHFSADKLIERFLKIRAKKVAVVHVMPQTEYKALKRHSQTNGSRLLLPRDGDIYDV